MSNKTTWKITTKEICFIKEWLGKDASENYEIKKSRKISRRKRRA
jgi:hypothetical protein